MEVDSDSGSRRLALIRAVRTLDEDGSIALPDKIQRLWLLLSETKATRFHGVEENILRWLFKHMSGNTENAEQVRRYPLTWTILSHIFPKIPSQTLGRSLASLRFVSVLRQTIGDITTARRKSPSSPSQTNGVASEKKKKRKRETGFPSDIEELRTPESCIKSASELFRALNSLLNQGNHRTGLSAPEQKVGAEHIKSLFSSSNDETRDIAAGLLLTCDRSLSILEQGISREQESWIGIIATLWNLRLHNKDDSLEFARHMYVPACFILARLRGLTGVAPVTVASNTAKNLWVRQLEQFLGAYFIRPARHTFVPGENIEALEIALGLSKRNLGGSAIITWDVAARTPRDSSNPKSKTEHLLWAQNVFEIFLNAIQPLESLVRNQVIIQMLETATQTNSVPNTAALRSVCREYALRPNEIDWNLVSKVVACDADVFLMDQTLMEDILGKISSYSSYDSITKETIVTKIILPLEDAFARTRNLSGFIEKWHGCLNESDTDSLDQSIWFDIKIRQRLASILQSSLTSTQLLRILERLDSPDAIIGSVLVVLDGISAGITEEDFINNADSKIFSAAFKDKSYKNLSSSVLSLRWRIAGRLASWETSDEVRRLWSELKPTLKHVLKKSALSNPETFEAFTCCHKLWLANYPGGKREADLAKLMGSFLERLSSKIKTKEDISVYEPYLNYIFRHLPKLAEFSKQETGDLRDLITNLFWHVGKQSATGANTQLDDTIRSLLRNVDGEDDEAFVDALISQPLDALDSAEAQSGWTQPQSLSLLLILLEFPRDAFTKGRRKRIMSSWKTWRSAIISHASQDSHFAVVMLRLLIKVMQQPTFYEDMEFDDLVYISNNLPIKDNKTLALIEKFIDLTLRQMVASTEGHSQAYLDDAWKFAESITPDKPGFTDAQMLLVKGLFSALDKCKSHGSTISLESMATKLSGMIVTSLSLIGGKYERAKAATGDESILLRLSIALSGAASLAEASEPKTIELSKETTEQLESISTSLISSNFEIGWKLRTCLFRHNPDIYDTTDLFALLDQTSETIDEGLVYGLVDAFVGQGEVREDVTGDKVLGELVASGKLTAGPIGRLLAIRRLVEVQQGPFTPNGVGKNRDILDLGVVHERLASLLSQVESPRHFRQLAEILVLLLDKHANSMTQINVETTLSSVVHVCSQNGPKLHGPKVAGEIYDKLYKLVALVLKRHRLRLRGHFPILLAALRALLSTLLSDPTSTRSISSLQARPPWLELRLKGRHAERFTRLLTLICEPSAASVARTRSSELDSATDVAKRAAGQDMFTVLELYIKLQLEMTIPRDVRKALELGVYSILDITPQGCRRVLNESLDANGRAIFREMFADYKKFGKWSGV
ncbi:Urb2/Npa2 family-domain-containing protein [Annulohypoxylon maeteangense]|uniref:Urb2/Npa2 family-domain-containing protein n=1 Tax=Annulohypoxylon maeteangense TaxID=1927788 RepID=UPI0020089FFE|nr:Urb2/Npa2 family-domain-containing protein [Annulohypoxylon maeteangense]KAI0881915.1 Urb2/Npa2 family-domain-containing protein [Annulohypoxylon maeteangense]